jgi:hypothetical protein
MRPLDLFQGGAFSVHHVYISCIVSCRSQIPLTMYIVIHFCYPMPELIGLSRCPTQVQQLGTLSRNSAPGNLLGLLNPISTIDSFNQHRDLGGQNTGEIGSSAPVFSPVPPTPEPVILTYPSPEPSASRHRLTYQPLWALYPVRLPAND